MSVKKKSFALGVLLLIVQLTILKIHLDLNPRFEMDPLDPLVRPAIDEISQVNQEDQAADDFVAFVSKPASEYFGKRSNPEKHLGSCGFRLNGTSTACSCCVGAMTFGDTETLMNGIFQPTPDKNEKLTATVKDIEPTTMLGIMNLGRLLGIHRAKPVLSAAFGAGNTVEDCGRQNNALWE